MSDEMKFRDEKFKEFWHSWKGTAKENDEHFKAEIYSSWCHSWSRAIASQPKGREEMNNKCPLCDRLMFVGKCPHNRLPSPSEFRKEYENLHPGASDLALATAHALASQAADEGKVGWGPLPTTEHYREQDPRDARIAELEAEVTRMREALEKLAKGNRAPGVLEIARQALRGSDGGGG